ncbi:hypothetical protein CLU82_3223 [Flavobacterium sp. 5]|nr:hypothetical protein CLU82_3223 [Flavobacterium sp. 5]
MTSDMMLKYIRYYENVFFKLLYNSQKRGVLFEENLVFLRKNIYYEFDTRRMGFSNGSR